MKKLVFLIIVVAVGVFIYQKTGLLDFAKSGGQDATLSESEACGEADSSDEASDGLETIGGCPMVDEKGEPVDLQEVLDAYSDRVIVLHACNPDRPHCPRKTDKPHFEAVAELASYHADDAVVVGINLYSPRKAVKGYKSYYRVDYPMLTADLNSRTCSNRDEAEAMIRQLQDLNRTIAGGDGAATLPTTLFIKDGKYVSGRVKGFADYQELEDALREAL